MKNETTNEAASVATAAMTEADVLRFEIVELENFRDSKGLPDIPVANDYMLKFALKDSRDVFSLLRATADHPALRGDAEITLARNIAARRLMLAELGEAA